jgi:glycosyltransferase involved in cell wall biosynthesis
VKNIIVSIFILTYNQEQFIAQTIESILMQKTNFTYQLVIGEDFSIDTTRNICETYARQFPEKIKLLPALENNIGLIANYMRTIKECDGKYIAICDGDDYWIDEYKLQKQVDFLENNPDYSIVHTALKRLYPDGTIKDYHYNLNKEIVDFDDLIFNNFICSVTCLFRNKQSINNQLPVWFLKFPFGDWQTYLWTVKDGTKIHFIEDLTSVYRMEIGVSSNYMKNNSSFIQVLIAVLKSMYHDKYFANRKEIIAQSISNKQNDLMTSLNREKSYLKAFVEFIRILKSSKTKCSFIKFYFYSIFKSFI